MASWKKVVTLETSGDFLLGDGTATPKIKISGTNTGTNLAATGHGGSSIVLRNSHDTDGNFSFIDGNNSNDQVDSRIAFVHANHSSRYGEIAFLLHNGSALTERIRIDKVGNVGIGTTTPMADSDGIVGLQISSGTATGLTLKSTGSSQVYSLWADSSDNLKITDNTANLVRFAINSSGNVSVGGGHSPSGVLDVRKNSSKVGFGTDSSADFGEIYFGSGVAINFAHETNDNAGGIINFRGYDNGTSQFRDLTIMDGKGSLVAFFDGSTARMGIGTDSPQNILHLSDATPALLMTDEDDNSECRIVNGGGNLYLDADLNNEISNSFIALRTDNGSEKVRITSTGRVGINNSAPTMELEIHQSTLAHGSNVGIRFYAENDSGTARDGHIIFDPDTQTIGLSKAGSAVDLGVTSSTVESVKNVNIDTGGTTSLTVDGNNTSGDDGRIYLKGYSSSGSRAYININNGVSSGGQNWYVGALRGSNSFAIGRGDDFGTNTDFYINSSGHAYFDNNVYIGNDKAIWFRNNADNADTSAIFTNTSDELVFRSGGSNDTVKINTTGLLTLQGSASPLFLMKNNDGNQQVQINCNTTSGAELDIYDHASSGKIRLSARSGSNSYWNTAGDSHFGIGTASPSKLFTVQSVQANEWLAKFENDSTTNPYGIYVDTTGASGLTYNFASYTGGGTGFFVRNDGVVGIGVDQPKIRLGQKLGLATTANYGGMSMNTYSANASQCSLLDFNKSNNATIGSHTAVANNTDLGYIVFRGSDGVEFLDACYIRASVDDAITGGGTDDMPGRMTFWTTPNGSPSPVERMRINSKGNIGLGRDPETAYSKELVVSCADNGGLTLFSENTAHASCIMFADGTSGNAQYQGQMVYDHNVDAFGIWTASNNALWIDQYGNTGIGTITPTDYDTSNHQVTSLALAGTWGGRYDNVFGSNVRSSWYMDTSQNTYFGTVGDYNLFLTQNGNTKVTIGSSAVTIANAVTISSASPIITLTDTDDNSDGRIVNGNGVLYLDADLNNEVSGSAISLRVDGGVEVMNVAKGLVQIPAKDLLVGADVNNGTKYVKLHGSAHGQIDVGGTGTVSDTRMSFINDNGSVGTIKTAASGTNYNTTSDYRLKENEVTLPDGLTKLEKLKPYRFNFKVDKDTTVDGFFAHEVQDIVPEAVSGEKDAVDGDGNIDAQGIDHSKLVPLLVKAVQELSAKVKELEAKV